MPSSSPASASRLVSATSSADGSGSPLGWLCTRATAAAFARIAALKAERMFYRKQGEEE